MKIGNSSVSVVSHEAGDAVTHTIATSSGTVVAACADTRWSSVRHDGPRLIFDGETGSGHATLTLEVPPEGSWVHGTFDATLTGRVAQLGVLYEFRGGDVEFAFAPHIRPNDDHTVAQWGMKNAGRYRSGRGLHVCADSRRGPRDGTEP